jgi:hypothetical protein
VILIECTKSHEEEVEVEKEGKEAKEENAM